MSSHVLKSLSDCYNFNDDSNDGKSRGKRRAVPRPKSSTSKSSNVKVLTIASNEAKDSKWRCDVFKHILSTAVWLNDGRADSRSTIDTVVEMLLKHIDSDCNCVNICSTHVLIGNTLFERFLFNQREFEHKVIREEKKCSEMQTKSNCNIKTQNPIMNDIPDNKESKLDSNVMPELVNADNMVELLAPLAQALDHWHKAVDLNHKYRVLTEESVIGLKLYYNLSSIYQIYCFYDQMRSRLEVSELLNRICNRFDKKESEMGLTSNYYLVKTYIDFGAYGLADNTLTRTQWSTDSLNAKQMPQTYGQSLNLLAKCEIDLLMGRTARASKTLKAFLDSDYLKKLTINRYYIKGLTLLLASKFTSKDFKFSNNFQEFLEPTQMSLCILKRWHSWLSTSTKSNAENQVINAGDLDPIWYKFAVLTFAFNAMQVSASFYRMIEMPIDSFFYYNALFKLGRRYCAAIGLSKLLIIGSELDLICDYKYWAHSKLDSASACIRLSELTSDSGSVFSSDSSVSTISPDTRRAIDNQSQRKFDKKYLSNAEIESMIAINICGDDSDASDSVNCGHNNGSNVFDLKRKIRKIENNLSDFEDSFGLTNTQSTNSIEDQNPREDFDLLLLKIEIFVHKLLLREKDPKSVLNRLIELKKKLMDSFRSGLKTGIQCFFAKYNDNYFENYFSYNLLKYKMIETIARLQLEAKEFEDVINTCNEVNISQTCSYADRLIHSNLLYFEAFSKFVLFKHKYSVNEDKVWVEFNDFLTDSMSGQSSTAVQSLTPPRPENKIKVIVPKAPKQKLFKTNEMSDYITALSNKVYEESKANVSTTGKTPFGPKNDQKLVFENDSEFRSLSVTEEKPTKQNIKAIPKSKPIPTPKPIERMTRSKTYLLENKTEPKVENQPKRSGNKSSKSNTSSETPIVIDLTDDLEGLDEVFDRKLEISDEMKDKKKYSKEDVIDLETIISLLKTVFDLISSHPSSRLYVFVNKLLVQIYSLKDNINEELIGYHFSESNASTYRYRNLFIAEKKRKMNRKSKYDLKSISFNDSVISPNNSYKIFTECLPKDWRVVQILTVENDSKIPELMVCRYQRGRKPVFLKIKSDPQKIIKHFMTHFTEIIERSNASIVNKDRETFWRLRYSLDEELMILLRSVEETWFGAFRGILFGQLQSETYQQMCKSLTTYILNLTQNGRLVCKSEALLEVMVESLPSLKYSEFRAAMKTLFNTPSDALIAKCFKVYEQMFCDVFPIDNKESIFTTYGISPVGLILDKSLEAFPFESLPSLQAYNQSIFRSPSLRVLSLMYNTFKDDIYSNGVNESNVFYVLNPADNLAKTEEYFKQTFVSMTDWNGVIGKPPEPSDLKSAFDSKDAYIFFGHGAGASYYRTIPEGLDGCTVNCASIVIGCSSGKLFSEGSQLQSYGTPYRFMMNGSPCYVGVLWDVTDKDIDKFSDQLLSLWFSKWKPELNDCKHVMPITKAVSFARKVCRLKHLIGAAPVVYGLPLVTKFTSNETL